MTQAALGATCGMTERRRAVLEGTRIRRVRNPTAGRIEAAVLGMARENVVVLSEADDDHVQVWQRPGGLLQLEHRAGSPVEHFQTMTVSADKVHAAFTAWLRRDGGWAAPFTWRSVSELL
ncbi:hypothetical protein [Lentzea atacamensis]|uniref:hypothetical protein n=1 Tax=Lentzea atacamensis TaxID=531938 RepID=UPI0011B82EDA|nr:hypothetical protein [Lentzea atacamensis]